MQLPPAMLVFDDTSPLRVVEDAWSPGAGGHRQCEHCHKFVGELHEEVRKLHDGISVLLEKFASSSRIFEELPHTPLATSQHDSPSSLTKVDLKGPRWSATSGDTMLQTRSQTLNSSFREGQGIEVLLPAAIEVRLRDSRPTPHSPKLEDMQKAGTGERVLFSSQKTRGSLTIDAGVGCNSTGLAGAAGKQKGKSHGRKLKLLPLWEEAYAQADEDAEYAPPYRQTGLQPNLKQSSMMIGRTYSKSAFRAGDVWRMVANPHSQGQLAWDCLGLILTTYDLASIPIEIAWNLPANNQGIPVWLVLFEILYWFVDMCLSFIRGYYFKGMVVWDLGLIRQRYLRTWFGFDMTLILVDCLLVVSRAWKMRGLVEATMWVRLIRMGRILKIRRTAGVLEEACITWRLPSASLAHAVIYTFAMILLLTHLVACFWYFIGSQGREANKANWLEEAGVDENANLAVEYVLCFHWVLAQFTPAPISVQPANPEERAFTVVVIFFTLFILGKGYQKMSQSLLELNASRQATQAARRQVQQFLAMHKVPLDLALRTTRFADHVLSRQTRVELDASLVSEHLRQELTTHQRLSFLEDHPLFGLVVTTYPDTICNICEALQAHSYDRGHAIFISGSMARCLYITGQGGSYVMVSGKVEETLQETHFLAEASLYASVVHASTLHATSFSDAMTLTAADFKQSVHHDPACSHLVLEYATALLTILRREGMSKDTILERHLHSAIETTKCYRMVHADTDALGGSQMFKEPNGSSTPELLASDGPDSFTKVETDVPKLLQQLQEGAIEHKDLVDEVERIFPELDPGYGVYAKLLYQDERMRTVVSVVNTLLLWNDSYEAFTAPQSQENKMSKALWRKMQLFVQWVGRDMDLMLAALVMITIRGVGNVAPLVAELPKTHHRTSSAVSYMIKSGAFTKHVPSVQVLPEHLQEMIADAFDIHSIFNLGHFMEGENLPSNILDLHESIKSKPNGQSLLKLYLLAMVGVMSGRDARPQLNEEQEIPSGSRFIDERRGRMLLLCIEVLEHVLSASPQAIYWSYMGQFAKGLQKIESATAEELALARLTCLSRSETVLEVLQMRQAWESLHDADRALLTDSLLADGITQLSVRFIKLPLCFANAKSNPCVGLARFLRVLAEILEYVKLQGCWSQTDALTLALDLQDLASFIISVHNANVFSTCLLRAELRQTDHLITLAMTSKNWLRATDTDNQEVGVFSSLHHIYVKQRAIEYGVNAGRQNRHITGVNGHIKPSVAVHHAFDAPRMRSPAPQDKITTRLMSF